MSSTSPSGLCAAVTPSDTVSFSECRALYVGTGGDLSVVCAGVTVVFANAQTGTILPVEVTRVNATGTTATNIIALY